ncbi:3'-5' exonuclease [Ligilactobacillus equi]
MTKENILNLEMTPEQEECIKFNGQNLLVRGTAGSGKSTVLLHRADYLARTMATNSKIMFTTFANSLINYIKSDKEDLEKRAMGMTSEIETSTVDMLSQYYFHDLRNMPIIKGILNGTGNLRHKYQSLSTQPFINVYQEIRFIGIKNYYRKNLSKEDYVNLARPTRFSREEKGLIYELYSDALHLGLYKSIGKSAQRGTEIKIISSLIDDYKAQEERDIWKVPATKWLDEINEMAGQYISKPGEYANQSRRTRIFEAEDGTEVRYRNEDRPYIEKLFFDFLKVLKVKGLYTISSRPYYVYTHISEIPEELKYDHILVDESQDLSKTKMLFLSSICKSTGGFSIAKDVAQKIYHDGYTFKEINIPIHGKQSKMLHQSFRSTASIINAAKILSEINKEKFGNDEYTDFVIPKVVGTKPRLFIADNKDSLDEFILREIKNSDFKNNTVAVVSFNHDDFNNLKTLLDKENLRYFYDFKSKEIGNQLVLPGIKLITAHSSKGLEFDKVIIYDVANGKCPQIADSITEEERNLLYVTMTRARTELVVTAIEDSMSSLIKELDLSKFESNKIIQKLTTVGISTDRKGIRFAYPLKSIPTSNLGVFTTEELTQAVDFANQMIGNTRERSHGSDHVRSNEEVFRDTLEGKLGEIAVAKQAHLLGYKTTLDFEVTPKSNWDNGDLIIERDKNGNAENGEHERKVLQVKTFKSFSQFLLLEKSDYDVNGNYIHVQSGQVPIKYDAFIAQRLNSGWTSASKELPSVYEYSQDTVEIVDFLKDYDLGYDVAYMLTHNSFVEAIQNNQVLGAGHGVATKEKTPFSTALEVDNYFVPLSELSDFY